MGRIEKQTIQLDSTDESRTLRVYLPEAYDRDPSRTFPLMVMLDGQDVFGEFIDESAAGQSWHVDDILSGMETDGSGELVVVAIDNAGEARYREYSPFDNRDSRHFPRFGGEAIEGEGAAFAAFVADTLLPWAAEHFRIDLDRVGIAGGSMGGLIALYIAARYPHIFQQVGAFSTALWYCEKAMLAFLKSAALSDQQTFHLHVGTAENAPRGIPGIRQIYVDNALAIQDVLLRKGLKPDRVRLHIHVGGEHTEDTWHRQLPSFLTAVLAEFGRQKDFHGTD